MNTDTTNTEKDIQSSKQNTYANVEKNQNNKDYLIERIEIEKTPFTVIIKDKEKFITFGRYRISPNLEPIEEALDWLNDHMWEVIVIMAAITYELHHEELQQQKKAQTDDLKSQAAP